MRSSRELEALESLTSFALFHSFKAVTMELYSPSFFAAFVSKPLASWLVNCLCSSDIARALARSAGGIASEAEAGIVRTTYTNEGSTY